MRTTSQLISHFVLICLRSMALRIVLISLLLIFGVWKLQHDLRVHAAPSVPVAAGSGFLYVLNDCKSPCPSQIFGFAVNEATGALTPLPSFSTPAGGEGNATSATSELLAIDRRNLRLFAINDKSDTVSAFAIDPANGALTPMFSPFSLPPNPLHPNTSPLWTTIAVRPSGSDSLVVVGDVGGNCVEGRLASFRVNGSGATLVGTPANTGSANPLSTAFSQNGAFVYTGGGFCSTIASFSVQPDGVLTPLNPLITNSRINPAAYVTDAQQRLFVASRPSSILLAYTTSNGVPSATPVNSPSPSGAGEAGPGVLHPNGFYIVSGRLPSNKTVSVDRIDNRVGATTLSRVNGSPFQSGGVAVNLLALNHAGKFLFAVSNDTRNITTFQVDPASGTLEIMNTQPSNTLGTGGSVSGIAYLPPFTSSMTIEAPEINCGEEVVVIVSVNSPAGTPTGNVLLSVDGGVPLSEPLVGDPPVATFRIPGLTVGDHSLVATFAAQNGFASISDISTVVVNTVETTTTIIDAPAITFGENGNVTVQVASLFGTPTGEVKLTVDGVELLPQTLSGGLAIFPIPGLNADNHTLVATFSPQGCFGTSSDTGTLVVKVAPTKTFVNAQPIVAGLDASVVVRVTADFAVPVGQVRLKVDGIAVPAKTLSSGSAIFVIRAPTVGIHILVADYAAQGNFDASSKSAKLIVKPAERTVTKIIAPPVTLAFPSFGQTAPVTVNVRRGNSPFISPVERGKVTLKVDNGRAMTQTLSGGTAIFNLVMPTVGFHFLKAEFLGQPGVLAPSTDDDILIVKGAGRPTETRTTIKAPAITFAQNGSVTVTVTSANGIPRGNVSLTVDNTGMMTKVISGGSATFIINRPRAGNHSLLATFTGTTDFVASKAIGTLVVNRPTTKP